MRDLLLPRACAGCAAPDEVLCDHCSTLLHQPQAIAMPLQRFGYALSCGLYQAHIRQAILQWKDHSDEECDRPFAQALIDAAAYIQLDKCINEYCAAQGINKILIVPAPSSAASLHERGRVHLKPLAHALAQALAQPLLQQLSEPLPQQLTQQFPQQSPQAHKNAEQVPVEVCMALSMHRQRIKAVQTQSASSRSERVQHSIRMNERQLARGVEAHAAVAAILLDDIVTTGATMRQCTRVLAHHGIDVLTGLCLAYTPSNTDTPSGTQQK
ncbi:ComF family protein [Bifidobacterium dolichotidis]|nr:ComF family protein [Bifidobacterium dolichotidis]